MKNISKKYNIIKTIESDGWASLYSVEKKDTGEKFLLKKFTVPLSTSFYETARKEFNSLKEGKTRIDIKGKSPSIIDFFTEEDTFYLVLEYKSNKCEKIVRSYPSIGKTLNNRYIVIKGVAEGGFGVVYTVRDLSLPGKYWALKEMQDKGSSFEIIERSFQVEAQMLATLEHPTIPIISDFFIESEKLYLVMEYVKGETLKKKLKLLKKNEYFPEEQIISWALSICSLLEYLHGLPKPVVFRDLKPDNILITPEGRVKVIDFGIARVFAGPDSDTTKFALLTAGYAPQEQWMGKAEPRSDIYALGATLFHLVTLVHPKKAGPSFPPVEEFNPSVSPLLSKIISKSLEAKAENRYQKISHLKEELLNLYKYKDIEKYLVKAVEYEAEEDYLKASFEYMKALEAGKEDNTQLLISIAGCYEHLELKDKAIEYYNKALSRRIGDSKRGYLIEKLKAMEEISLPAKEKSNVSKDRIYKETEEISEIFELEEEPLELSLAPVKNRPYLFRGIIIGLLTIIFLFSGYLWNKEKRFQDAEKWNNKGLSYYSQNNYREAIRCYDKALEIDPGNDNIWYNKGNLLYSDDKYEEAAACYERALAIDPKDTDTWDNRGLALAKQKKYDESIECFDRALALDPLYTETLNNKGMTLIARGEYEEAVKCFSSAISLDDTFTEAYINKSLALKYLKKYEEALKILNNILKIDPENSQALELKGSILYKQKKYDEALSCYDRAIENDMENEELWLIKGNILYAKKDYKEALETYKTAKELGISDKEIDLRINEMTNFLRK